MAGYGYPSDHQCRPVIIDSEGRTRPIIDYGPNYSSEGYVRTRVQRTVEHVHRPVVVAQYTHGTQATVRPLVEDYNEIDDGAGDHSWSRRPSSPVHDHPQVVEVPEYGYNFPLKSAPVKNHGVPGVSDRPQVVVPEYPYDSPRKVEPVKSYGASNDKYGRPLSPVRERPHVVVPKYREPVKSSYPAGHNPVNRDTYQKVGYNPPNKVEPMTNYGTNGNNYRPQALVPKYRSPEKEEPLKDSEAPKVKEFFTKVQTPVSPPRRTGLLNAAAWRKLPDSTAQGGTTDYSSEYNPASGNSIPVNNGLTQPIIINRDEQERPAWTSVVPNYNTKPANGNSISTNNGFTEPIITNRDGHERPAWNSMVPNYNTKPISGNSIPNNNGSIEPIITNRDGQERPAWNGVAPSYNTKPASGNSIPSNNDFTEPKPAWTSVPPSYTTKPVSGYSIPDSNGSMEPIITNRDDRERPAWNSIAPSYNTKPANGNSYPNNNGSTKPTVTNRDGWERPAWTNVAPNYSTKPAGGNFIPNNNGSTEPTITNGDGRGRPDWRGTIVSPSYDTPLSGATNDIGNAMEILKLAIKSSESAPYTVPFASQSRVGTAPALAIPKRDAAYTETIDSREAARRYNNPNSSSRPGQEQGRHTRTITSREAAQKYEGETV